jgi:hypothetical protein
MDSKISGFLISLFDQVQVGETKNPQFLLLLVDFLPLCV